MASAITPLTIVETNGLEQSYIVFLVSDRGGVGGGGTARGAWVVPVAGSATCVQVENRW